MQPPLLPVRRRESRRGKAYGPRLGGQFNGFQVPLTVLREEVTVDDLNQAVQLLDGQQAHGNVEDEISKHFAVRMKKRLGKNSEMVQSVNETVWRETQGHSGVIKCHQNVG